MSSPRYDWWGYIKAVIRRYPALKSCDVSGVSLREKEAVRAAVEATESLRDGAERLRLIDMVFWRQTHTLAGAAMQIPCSERTAQEWHRQFIRLVAKNIGLMD